MEKESMEEVVSNLYKDWRETRFIARKGRVCTFEGAKFHIRDLATKVHIKVDTLQEAVSFMV